MSVTEAEEEIPLSPHLRMVKKWAEDYQKKFPMVDRHCPLQPDDGREIARLNTSSLSYYFTEKVVIKRQPHLDECDLDKDGNPAINPYIADRLRNEAAMIKYLTEHTTIPVPKFLDLWEFDGLICLKTAIVRDGEGVESMDESLRPAAIQAITDQMDSEILPQLRKLRRDSMGSPDPSLPVIPPRRLWAWKEDRVWPALVGKADFTLSHMDLRWGNFILTRDPDSRRILCVVDWEGGGYFPESWELHYWKANGPHETSQMSRAARDRELAWISECTKKPRG